MPVSPVDAPYIPAKYKGDDQVPTLSVIHSTVGPTKKGSARAIARYGQNPSSPSSWHYAIDAAEVIQSVYDHTVAYHCGYNQNSLGYEMCDNPSRLNAARWLGRDHKAMLDRTARAVARNHAAYGIPVRYLTDDQLRTWARNGKRAKDGGITTHAQMSRVFKRSTHWDPGAWPSKKFLALVKKYHGELVNPPKPTPAPTVTSDVRFVLANVKSNPLMSPAKAKEDYDLAFQGARAKNAQAVYINEYHRSYASVLAASAKAHGYKVRGIDVTSGLAVATKATGWTLSGLTYSLLAGGIRRISPNRGVLRVGERTPAGTRVVWDCLMLPRGWNNPRYSGFAKTSAMARTIFSKLKPIIVSQTGTWKSVAVVGGDVNQGAEVDWNRHLGLKPAATLVCPGNALDKMMQAAVFVPSGATAEVVEETNLGKENTDHGIMFGHVRVTRPR